MLDPFTRKRRECALQSAREQCAKMGFVVVGSGMTAEGKIWLQVLEESPDEPDTPEDMHE